MSTQNNSVPIDDMRYLLQIAAHHDINILPSDYTEMLDEITNSCKESQDVRENIKTVLNDLSLYHTRAENGTVLESIKRCLIPQNVPSEDNVCKIIYNCSNVSLFPIVISEDTFSNQLAIIYIDTVLFGGFEREHYEYLKNNLGIENIKIIFKDDNQEIPINDGYEHISKYLKHTEFSPNLQFDITQRPIVIILITIILIIIFMTPKLVRKM